MTNKRNDKTYLELFSSLSQKNRKNISETLFERLRDAILCGDLPSGYMFPNENELCQALNIGRGSLREAYASLETLHLITRSKSGTCVNDQQEIQNDMNFKAIAQLSDVKELSEYRMIIEVGAVQLAAQNIRPDEIAKMEKIFAAMQNDLDDPIRLSQYDFDFHSLMIKAARNQLLTISFHTIRAVYEEFTETVFASGYAEQSLLDHGAILDALRIHDPDLAAEMMKRHLLSVEKFRSKP